MRVDISHTLCSRLINESIFTVEQKLYLLIGVVRLKTLEARILALTATRLNQLS